MAITPPCGEKKNKKRDYIHRDIIDMIVTYF